MRYLPHTQQDIEEMLAAVGVQRLEDLFGTVPADCRRCRPLDLPAALDEWQLNAHMDALAGQMAAGPPWKVFLGAGSYAHFVPEIVPALASRAEFVTAYTPYQPEMSQGTLQAIYEYQTMTARLLGLEVANASLYDGATALAEAILMAMRVTGRTTVAVSRLVHPCYRQVSATYLAPTDSRIVEMPYGPDGTTPPGAPIGNLAAVVVQSPNFFGCIEDLSRLAAFAHDQGAMLIAAFTEPVAFGLYKNPGSQGADIACGEGQSLGLPPSFGGPGLGMFACLMAHVRSMPGRLVGKTKDIEDRTGFVLTLATREQHIRREKATSNICTNASLCALTAAVTMASLGKTGFCELARLNHDKAQYLKTGLRRAGVAIPFDAPTFNEFVVRFADGFNVRYQDLLDRHIVAGLPLEPFYPELAGHYLLCATDLHTRTAMDNLIQEVTP
jgi:glycine dehydrogenase subunit 1